MCGQRWPAAAQCRTQTHMPQQCLSGGIPNNRHWVCHNRRCEKYH
nr:hypothetical protein FD201807_092L [Megalocytivirus FD201807]